VISRDPHRQRRRRRITGLARALRARHAHLAAEPERGSVAAELTLVVPIFVLLLLLIVGLGRASDASIKIQDAAHAAARAATLAATPGAAEQAASQAAGEALTGSGTTCQAVNVSADVGSLSPGAMVSVTVSCTVNLSDLSGIAIPGVRTISASSSSVVDRYGAATGAVTGG